MSKRGLIIRLLSVQRESYLSLRTARDFVDGTLGLFYDTLRGEYEKIYNFAVNIIRGRLRN